MDDERDLLDAIRENPADDNVRLVYADWLQDHGRDGRASILRRSN